MGELRRFRLGTYYGLPNDHWIDPDKIVRVSAFNPSRESATIHLLGGDSFTVSMPPEKVAVILATKESDNG